jgi:aldehyde dehydrogenase (NAD+)
MTPSATSNDAAGHPPGKPERIEDRLFINGEFIPSISGKKFDLYNPTTEKLSASVYEAGAEDVDEAVKAAKAALPAWSELAASTRGAYLSKLADAIEKVLPEMGYLDCITMGKPYIGDSKPYIRLFVLTFGTG